MPPFCSRRWSNGRSPPLAARWSCIGWLRKSAGSTTNSTPRGVRVRVPDQDRRPTLAARSADRRIPALIVIA